MRCVAAARCLRSFRGQRCHGAAAAAATVARQGHAAAMPAPLLLLRLHACSACHSRRARQPFHWPLVTAPLQAHWDYFFDKVNGESNGGNRYATVLMYLNDVEEGGETGGPAGRRPGQPGPLLSAQRQW